MKDHTKILFSQQALKAWIAGLVVFVAPYVVSWLNTLTTEQVSTFFGQYGLQLSEAGSSAIVAICGILAVYVTRNRDNG